MKIIKPLFLVFCMLCLSCDNILDCVVNKSPEIPDKSFEVGNVNDYYYQELISEIKNEPRDDDYEYTYEIYGNLPDGLEMNANFRTLLIQGMPTGSGTFTFTIHLYVEPPVYYDHDSEKYKDDMCSRSISKKCTIIIN